MNNSHDKPHKRTSSTTNASASANQAVDTRADRVKLIFEKKHKDYCLFANKYIDSMEDAMDIVSSAFEGAIWKWPAERFEAIRNLEAYLFKTVKHRAINFAKRQQRLISIHEFPVDTFLISNPMEKFDLDIDALVNQLPTKQRVAFAMFLEDYSHEEIAEKLNISIGASKNLVYYAKKNLKKLLSDLPEFDPDDRGPSNASKTKRKGVSKHNKIALSAGPGFTPKVKDLLNYLGGGNIKENNKRAILHWLIYQDYAIEILSGLKLALKKYNAKNLETMLNKEKDNLRERLFGSTHHNDNQNKPGFALSSLIDNWNLENKIFNNNANNKSTLKHSMPSIHVIPTELNWRFNNRKQSPFDFNPIKLHFYLPKKGSIQNIKAFVSTIDKNEQPQFKDLIQYTYNEYSVHRELPKQAHQQTSCLIELNNSAHNQSLTSNIIKGIEPSAFSYSFNKTTIIVWTIGS